MKKYIFCGLLLFFCACPLYSQVGINTESPEGALHIKSQTLPAENKGVLVGSDGSNGISVAIDDTGYPSASVSLGAGNKAFIPNLVALADARGSAISNPVKNPAGGMVVYNTARAGVVPNNVIPGLYVFDGSQNRWMYCITDDSRKNVQTYTLNSSLALEPGVAYSNINGYATLNLLPVGSSPATPAGYIEARTDAAYAVALSLSGSIENPSGSFQKMIIYVAAVLLKNDGTADRTLDAAVINPVAFTQGSRVGGATYPLTLGFDARRGDRISIMVALNTGQKWTLLPDETTIVFFKI